MLRSFAVLALVLAGLVAADRALSSRAAEERAASPQVRRLVTAEQRARWQIAALTVEEANGSAFIGRDPTGWRFLSHQKAWASEQGVNALIDALTNAEGHVQTLLANAPGEQGAGDPAAYGLDAAHVIRLTLHGPNVLQSPSKDVLHALEIGAAIPGEDACFAREQGSREVWTIDADLPKLLARKPGLPPLIDLALVPSAWPGMKTGLERVRVEVAGREPLEVVRHRRELTPEELQRNESPWSYTVESPGATVELDPYVAGTFCGFALRAPFAGLLPAAERGAALFEAPVLTLTLVPGEGEPLVLAFGQTTARELVPVLNVWSDQALELEPLVAELLAPDVAMLTGPPDENPWTAFMEREPDE
jgi:hypothetical protein